MAIKLFPLGITGEEVKRRLNLAVHNSLFFDSIVTTISPTVNETKVTSASNYTIVYLSGFSDDDVHHGIFALLVDGTYNINWSIERGGETVTDSAWYNNGYIVRSDRTFICRSDRQLYIYDNTQMYRVTNDGTPGTPGSDGITPHIDPTTKHWMIGDEDTGIVAEGKDGEYGTDGTDGQDGKSAFDIWLENGHSGNISDFLAWMKDTSSMLGPKFAETVSDCLMVNDTPTLYFVPNGTTFNVYLADSDGQGINAHSLAIGVPGDITNYAGIYDISQDKAVNGVPAQYGNLSEALGAITDSSKKKGGMTIKFIDSESGKYVQYRYTRTSIADIYFRNEANWVLSELPIENTSNADLEFSDNNGNVLARYKDGHHETKNWSSDKSQQNTGERDYNVFSSSSNYAVGDIVLKDGLLYKFTSEHEAGDWDDSEVEQTSIAKIVAERISKIGLYTINTETGDFEVSDNYGNVIFQVAGGHARTKHFDSRNIPQGNVNNASYKFACLGDSITSNQNWNVGGAIREVLGVTYLQESTSDSPDAAGNCTTEFGNLAVGNATMSDWSNTIIQLTKDSGSYYENNVVSNQVRRLLQHTTPLGEAISWVHPIEGDTYSIDSSYGVGKGFVNDKPDIILIAAGTNDWGGNRYIDTYDTVIGQSYSQLDRLTVCSALRWAIETLQINYPYAKIFVETPICRTVDVQDIPTKVKTVAESIRKLCRWLGVQFIDANYYSGVGELTMKSGWMTPDGTHPNDYGKRNISLFVAGQIKAGFGRLV